MQKFGDVIHGLPLTQKGGRWTAEDGLRVRLECDLLCHFSIVTPTKGLVSTNAFEIKSTMCGHKYLQRSYSAFGLFQEWVGR